MRRKFPIRHAWLLLGLVCLSRLSAQQSMIAPGQLSTIESQFKSAAAAYDSGNFVVAATQLESLEKQAPKSFEVHELLGMTYGAQTRDVQAVEQLQTAVSLRPELAIARNNLATALVRAGRPQQAESEWRQALVFEPHNYSATRNLAQLYLRQNKVADALPLLDQAHRIAPAALDNTYDLALADLLLKHDKESRALIAELQAQHDSGDLHNLLGQLDESEGKFVDAANQFATATRMDPSENNLFVWGSELLLHRAYESAIAVFRNATQRFPASPRLWIGLGMALYSRGEYEPSIQSLLTAADLNPTDARCYLYLSKAYLSSPAQAEAVIQRFYRYADLEPDNALAQYYYATSLWKGRRVDKPEIDYKVVEELLRKSITLDGSNAEAHLQLGILYNDQHTYEKALPEYQRAVQLNPNLADAHFRLGRYYLRAGDPQKSQAELGKFKELQAQHQAALDKERAEVQQFVTSNIVPSAGH